MKPFNLPKLATLGALGLSTSAITFLAMPEVSRAATFPFEDTGVMVQTRVFNKYDPNTGQEIFTGTFQTEMEMLKLNISLPDLGTAMVREDPDRVSSGETTVTDIGGGQFQIDSFFNIFTEISIDGGLTWIDSEEANRVDLVPSPTSPPGIIAPSPLLPPDCPPDTCGYLAQFHSAFKVLGLDVRLLEIYHFGFGNINRTQDGLDQVETFGSTITGQVQVAPIPEPSATVSLAMLGLAGLWGLKKKYSSKQN